MLIKRIKSEVLLMTMHYFAKRPAVSGVGSSAALAETSQVLLAGVPGVFSRGSPVFAHLLVCPSHMS